MTETHPQAAESSPVLTVDEVAKLLRISRGLAFASCRSGAIPHVRIGRRILIPRSAIDALLASATQPASYVGRKPAVPRHAST